MSGIFAKAPSTYILYECWQITDINFTQGHVHTVLYSGDYDLLHRIQFNKKIYNPLNQSMGQISKT